ncbi:DEAD/DEAH box helicase family protein [Pseudooceanicola onchidii]|uniref:DEAD/DEAH box helicase family protein n=1 Tax=Pseudooceanicola onchidii TaxID=2562279 RepID=UPI0010AAE278|nr:DEAD/DEAH box helicase family protein [Pseudooceanicola onchidii]
MSNRLFQDLQLPLSVRTTSSDPIVTFFNPVLSCAQTYDVAVGFFSSNWVRDAAAGIAKFALNGGKVRWIVSPILSEEDFSVLQTGNSEAHTESLIEQSFERLFEELQSDTRSVISWMIRDYIMEFRVAIPKSSLSGMMHAKMGVFSDSQGSKIGFSGSYNHTAAAKTNWEKIDIYDGQRSEEATARIEEIEQDFENMWSGLDPNIQIYLASEKVLSKYIEHTHSASRPYRIRSERWPHYGPPRYLLDEHDKLRDYQEDAVDAWLKNKGRGLFAMATGSGKTVTALSAASRIANRAEDTRNSLAIVITVPYQHLADQWIEEARSFNFSPVLCYGGVNKWIRAAEKKIINQKANLENTVVFVAVNDTFSSLAFQELLEKLPRNSLLIADEVHNLGAPYYSQHLPENCSFRMGLSATPVRHGDEVGTKAIEDFFGKPIFEFSLRDAIGRGFLCPYRYYPILSPFSEDEMAEYKDLSDKIAKAYARSASDDNELNDVLKTLLIKRARLVSKLSSKTDLLKGLLAERSDSSYNLVYCGDAKEDGERQIEQVVRLVGRDLKMRANKFTADENTDERKVLLEEFTSGELQVLAAIRCLDEGVDVPRTETAYILASSTNPRQFIQRRGRVLRKSPGKTEAAIYDFIAVPDLEELRDGNGAVSKLERNLVAKEMDRVNEFANMALNKGEALSQLNDIKSKLHLLHL